MISSSKKITEKKFDILKIFQQFSGAKHAKKILFSVFSLDKEKEQKMIE